LAVQEKKADFNVERTVKRSNDGTDLNSVTTKRVKSTVVVKNIDEPSFEPENPAPRPTIASSEGDRMRNRRLFGNLLMGTLTKFKEESAQTTPEVVSKRAEVDKQIEQKVEKDQENFWSKERDSILSKKKDCETQIEDLKKQIAEKEKESKEKIYSDHYNYLEYYCKTKTKPSVCFRPHKCDEWSQTTFGFKVPEEEADTDQANKIDMELIPESENTTKED